MPDLLSRMGRVWDGSEYAGGNGAPFRGCVMKTKPTGDSFIFTEKRLRDLPEPEPGKRARYRDEDCPGLTLRVTPGAKVFAYRIWKAELTIGRWPAWSVEQARTTVRQKIAPNPQAARAAKQAARGAQTLADAWAALLAHPWRRDGKGPLRPSTLVCYKAGWEHLKPYLSARPVGEIDGKAVSDLRAKLLTKHGPAQTRGALILLVVLLGGRMPRDANGRTIGKPSLEPRHRFMEPGELGPLLRGLEAELPLWRVFWLCCLLAPLRRGNIARARWSDLNLDQPARWIVSGADAKGGKLLAMPIAEPLAVILRDWKARNPGAEWVFPAGLTAGRRAGKGPIVSVQHAWARALLLGEAVRLCDAIGPREGMTGKVRFTAFMRDVDALRGESWRLARDRVPMEREGTPLARSVALLRERATALHIDPAPLALRDLTPHDLRRTAASWAVQSGASMKLVASSLGHADTRVTEAHYGHLSDDPVRRMLTDNAVRLLATTQTPPA